MRHKPAFFALIAAAFLLFGFHKVMFLHPTSVHQWRQCDSAAYALNYWQTGAPFFRPETMTLLGENGRTISEFPIIYWIAGRLYGAFGFHEWMLRMLTFGAFVAGLFGLFQLGRLLFRDKNWAFLPPLFLLASPLLAYYALNFLPNCPALGLTLGSWAFFFLFLKKRRLRDFLFCSLAATFAALLKPVEIFNFGAMLAILGFEFWGMFGLPKTRPDGRAARAILMAAILTIGINCAWIAYARWYAAEYGYIGNLLEILPVWDMTGPAINECWTVIKTKWAYQMYYPYFYGFLLAASVAVVVFNKKIDRYLFIVWLLVLLSQLAFVLLFFQAFYHHDYYWINTAAYVAFTLLCLISLLEKLQLPYSRTIAAIALTAFLLINFKHARHIIHERYYGNLREGTDPQLYENLRPYLRSLGIQKTDKIISVPDRSPNITPYFLQQKAWTECYTNEGRNIQHFAQQGARYLVVNGAIDRKPEWYQPYLGNQIGEFRGVKIYRLGN